MTMKDEDCLLETVKVETKDERKKLLESYKRLNFKLDELIFKLLENKPVT